MPEIQEVRTFSRAECSRPDLQDQAFRKFEETKAWHDSKNLSVQPSQQQQIVTQRQSAQRSAPSSGTRSLKKLLRGPQRILRNQAAEAN